MPPRYSRNVIKRTPVTVKSGEAVTLNIGPENSKPVVPTKEKEPARFFSPVKPRTDATMKEEDPDAAAIDPAADIIVTGRVTDDTGMGLVNAKLLVSLTSLGDEFVHATTDNDGSYSLRIPADAARPAGLIRSWTIWCYAEGRQIAAASVHPQTKGVSRKPVDFALKPASDTGFDVKTTAGVTVPNARVEPFSFMAGN
jgi:hypothetical protein